jgi:pimeloyl-ACP methyl ester carboxylesterase
MRTLGTATEQDWLDTIAPALFGSKYVRERPDRIRNLARWRGRHPAGRPRDRPAVGSVRVRSRRANRLAEICYAPTLVIHGGDDRI